MGFLNWLGFRQPRDAPGLPDVSDSVRDSGTVFMFGRANSGEQVDEKSAMQIATVYACVRLLAESVAQLPLHLYRTDCGEGQEKATDHPLYKILYREPNPEMTSFSFWEAAMTHLLLWGNAYAQIVRDGKNGILGLYPLLPENVEIDRDGNGELYYIYHAYTDEVPGEKNRDIILRREEMLHIPGLSFNGLVGFSPIAMMKNSLGTTMAVEKYGSAFFKNGAQPAGVLEHPGVLKDPQKRIRERPQGGGARGGDELQADIPAAGGLAVPVHQGVRRGGDMQDIPRASPHGAGLKEGDVLEHRAPGDRLRGTHIGPVARQD